MNQKVDDKSKQQQVQALRIIQAQVITLRKRMSSYGISTEQFVQIMQGMLGKILSKGRPQKIKTVSDLIKAIEEYVSRKKGKTLKLLIQIMANIDCQISEFESSSHPSQQSQDHEDQPSHNLKIDGKIEKYSQNLAQIQKKKTNLPIQNNQKFAQDCYVKLQQLPDINNNIQECVQVQSVSNKRRQRKRNKMDSLN